MLLKAAGKYTHTHTHRERPTQIHIKRKLLWLLKIKCITTVYCKKSITSKKIET